MCEGLLNKVNEQANRSVQLKSYCIFPDIRKSNYCFDFFPQFKMEVVCMKSPPQSLRSSIFLIAHIVVLVTQID